MQRDGRILAVLSGEPMPVHLDQAVRDAHYKLLFLHRCFGISKRHLNRVFEDGIGISPGQWVRELRMVAARNILRQGASVKEASIDLGFATPKVFAKEFLRFYGVTPTAYQLIEANRASLLLSH